MGHTTTRDKGVCPTSNGGMQSGSSVGMCPRCVHVFGMLGTNLPAQSVLSNEISASELRRKFAKSALLVGWLLLLFC